MSKHSAENCPLRGALKVLGGKWTMIIIKGLGERELRLSEMKRAIPDISEKVLIGKLKDLVALDIVTRKDYKQLPPKVGYLLTTKGKEALAVVQKVEQFGVKIGLHG